MTRFSAKAHTRTDRTYSIFHQSLLHDNSAEDYALKHLYSLENTKALLEGWGWTPEQIKLGTDRLTIDVYEKVVYLHIPNFIEKKGDRTRSRGLSRFVSKMDYVDTLIKRAWAKADPYKLQLGGNWDEFIAMGNGGDFYQLQLDYFSISCTCHNFNGLRKAFQQDPMAGKYLIENDMVQGQLPDKHVFAIWKYLGAETQRQYEYQYVERRDRFLEESERSSHSWQYEPEEEFEVEF